MDLATTADRLVLAWMAFSGQDRVIHSCPVDDLLVELIDLLISIRYAHPTLVQLELALTEGHWAETEQ